MESGSARLLVVSFTRSVPRCRLVVSRAKRLDALLHAEGRARCHPAQTGRCTLVTCLPQCQRHRPTSDRSLHTDETGSGWKHLLRTHRETAAFGARLGAERLDHRAQLGPRHHLVHLSREYIPPRGLPMVSETTVRLRRQVQLRGHLLYPSVTAALRTRGKSKSPNLRQRRLKLC